MRTPILITVLLTVLGRVGIGADTESERSHAEVPAKASPAKAAQGHVEMLHDAVNAAVESAADGEATAFVTAFEKVVASYDAAADELQSAFRESGQALLRIELARDGLNQLCETPLPAESSEFADSADAVRRLRKQLVDELEGLQADYEAAEGHPGKRQRLVARMTSTIGRVESLDATLVAAEVEGRQFDFEEVSKPLQALEEEIRREREILLVEMSAVRRLMESLVVVFDRDLQYLDLEAGLPREALARLKKSRERFRAVMTGVRDARRSARTATARAAERSPHADDGDHGYEWAQQRIEALTAAK